MTTPPANRTDPAEAARFLAANPGIRYVEMVFTGLNGVSRGKRLRVHELVPIYEQGRFLPGSTLVADITGRDVEQTGLVWDNGDADVAGWPIADTLVCAPWLGEDARIAKGVALRHGAEATFMAKPFSEQSGSGFHIHVSVEDDQGRNIFASPMDAVADTLRHAIGGMTVTLSGCMAILAPNANSYRRFRANSYPPVSTSWGVNNRTVPFRVPAGGDAGRHIEYRVAGADANPYLAVAVMLAAVHHGITNQVDPGAPVVGNGYAVAVDAQPIPTDWLRAIELFEGDALLADYLGERFVRMFSLVKRAEYARFNEIVTRQDYDWYLRTA